MSLMCSGSRVRAPAGAKGPWCSGSTWDSESHDPGSNPGGPFSVASMAEWSKAFDSSSNIRMNAWVRIPLDACVTDSMAEWLRRVIRNHMGVARGSSNLSAVVLLEVVKCTRLHTHYLLLLIGIDNGPLSSDGRAFAF